MALRASLPLKPLRLLDRISLETHLDRFILLN
jgi:hypothetical protein